MREMGMSDALDLAIADVPDHWTVLLPSRAYLLSVRDQTLPSRRFALEDAVQHYALAAADSDLGVRDMALLGIIGEALQVTEDIAYFATAFSAPIPGLAHYVSATIYNDRTPNNFYSSMKKRSAEELKVIAGLWVYDQSTNERLPVHCAIGVEDQLDEEDRDALTEAEEGTVQLLRPYLMGLAKAWDEFRRYFHAYKHGGLVISRDDFELLDEQGARVDPSIHVWLRRAGDGAAWGDTNMQPDEVAEQVHRNGVLALDVFDYLVDTRLATVDLAEFNDDGTIRSLRPPSSLWTFWFHSAQVSEATRERLTLRFGMDFKSYHPGAPSNAAE
jgi:hypothetical protein